MLPSERALIPDYMQTRAGQLPGVATLTPPQSPVRTMAEWEELQGLQVTWNTYTSIIREIIRAARLETTVYVVCTNPASVISSLLTNGIDTSNVVLVNAPNNSVWCRDYGPWSAYTNEVDTLITIDWIYNRPRPSDDQVPVVISNLIGTPLYQTTTAPWNLVHTGGNFMTDGAGTGFSSNLVDVENSPAGGFGINHTPAEVDSIMYHFMGINRYIKMTALPYDVIHHIDMHMKLLDEETILMGEYPQGVSDGPQIEANLQYVLANYTSVYGTPYKVIRIPMPSDNGLYPSSGGDYLTYTNSSFINNTVIVPTYGIPADTTALNIYREALPGYTITGINSNASIGSLGALHCITKEVGTSDPLLIRHQALGNTTDTVNDYIVNAYIRHRSGIQTAMLFWTTDTAMPYNSLQMSNTGGNDFTASIPSQLPGTTVFYYIQATAVSGKVQNRPMPAPAGYWKFEVTGTTGIASLVPQNELLDIYPNPSRGITCIPLNLYNSQNIKVILNDAAGKFVDVIFEGFKSSGKHNLFTDTSFLAPGIYHVTVQTGQQTYHSRIAVR